MNGSDDGRVTNGPSLEVEEDPAVSRFREYLRIKTVQPNPDYAPAIKFLKGQAYEIGLSYQCIQVAPERNVVIMSWEGTDTALPSLMLNSHMDVVPVFPEKWSCDPFEAVKRENGDIMARGAQDMKCVGIQYLEAIRLLKASGFQPLRTIHLTYVPDEEIGGLKGMQPFLKMETFKMLNVGFALDEGLANPTEAFTVFYAERTILWLKVTCFGCPGHASRFVEETAAEKLIKVMNKFMDFRKNEEKRLKEDSSLKLGHVNTINITVLSGGVQPNVIPSEVSTVIDLRVTPLQDMKEFKDMIHAWLKDAAGDDFEIEWLHKDDHAHPTSIDESKNPWWKKFKNTCDTLGMKLETEIFPAGTDSRYLRQLGLPVLGFSPMNHTPVLLHDNDEFLNERIFLRGIDIYKNLITNLSNL
ncbi:PREDICTED: aminoacylase-1A-like [Amphimedon queenslandica]|uniref:N-acyl-aliphatic-L-amino acid amidohydrolase n=1 Tax=Amphimedon queenslandica TaxID=400682 RepID=A0A1X7UEQ3_AMPQE|nr:PREDICTED: aminoacylase-1A-like [Amphimedon queenslandica]|eukprot:XP_019854695.1 PREDICTED: aminoacylase-1A-like [Amphimedon queenslandica]